MIANQNDLIINQNDLKNNTKKTKRIRARDEGIDFSNQYPLSQALSLIKEKATAKFDETVEVIFVSNLDPRKGDQNVRGMVQLPMGTGKTVRVAVFAEGEQAQLAKEAGADIVGSLDLIEEVQKGKTDFDLCIASPSMMAQLSKLGKILGPKGLMPNPKLGTVTNDTAAAVKAAKQGQASFRTEKGGIIHSILGKASFPLESLVENFTVLHKNILDARPASLKGDYIKKIYVSSTMGAGLLIDCHKGACL